MGPDGGIGRRASFRCWCLSGRGGSSPLLGTIQTSADVHKSPPTCWILKINSDISSIVVHSDFTGDTMEYGTIHGIGAGSFFEEIP